MALVNLTGIAPVTYETLADGAAPAEGQIVLAPLSRVTEEDEGFFKAVGKLGVLLDTETSFADIAPVTNKLSFVVIAFPAFTDGRGFSLAVRLRKDYNFKGEIRAVGPVIPDQAQFLARAGFDTVEVADERVEAFEKAASRFKSYYQADFVGGRSVAHARHASDNAPSNSGAREAS